MVSLVREGNTTFLLMGQETHPRLQFAKFRENAIFIQVTLVVVIENAFFIQVTSSGNRECHLHTGQ